MCNACSTQARRAREHKVCSARSPQPAGRAPHGSSATQLRSVPRQIWHCRSSRVVASAVAYVLVRLRARCALRAAGRLRATQRQRDTAACSRRLLGFSSLLARGRHKQASKQARVCQLHWQREMPLPSPACGRLLPRSGGSPRPHLGLPAVGLPEGLGDQARAAASIQSATASGSCTQGGGSY